MDIADALLAREVLDADQVRRLAYGHPLDDAPAAEIAAGRRDAGEGEGASVDRSADGADPKPLAQE